MHSSFDVGHTTKWKRIRLNGVQHKKRVRKTHGQHESKSNQIKYVCIFAENLNSNGMGTGIGKRVISLCNAIEM